MSSGTAGAGSLRATLIAWEDTFVTLITRGSGGALTIVALEVTPQALIGEYSPEIAAAWRNTWVQRLANFTPGIDLATTSWLLQQIFDPSAFLPILERSLRRSPDFRAPIEPITFPVELSESAMDAWIYVEATGRSESPRQAVAEKRGVTRRTAEGRIRRARERELLTQPKNNRASSMLTAKAADVLAERLGHRPYPYVAENGEVVLGPTE